MAFLFVIYIHICLSYIHTRCLNKFPTFLYRHLKLSYTLKNQYVIAIHLMKWLTNFYDFRFKSTATAVFGIHPTKA